MTRNIKNAMVTIVCVALANKKTQLRGNFYAPFPANITRLRNRNSTAIYICRNT